jgi:hypothetical protein
VLSVLQVLINRGDKAGNLFVVLHGRLRATAAASGSVSTVKALRGHESNKVRSVTHVTCYLSAM